MAATPAYASTVIVGTGTVPGTADTSLTSPTNYTALTWSTAIGSSGAKIEEVKATGLATVVAGVLNIFLYDGSAFHLFDQFTVTAFTSSTTAAAWTETRRYDNLFIPSGWTLRVSNTVSGNVSLIKVEAFGANF